MPKPMWVIFDVGGVLFDYKRAFRAIANYLNEPEDLFLKEFYDNLGPGELGEIRFDDIIANALKTVDKHHEHQNVLDIWWGLEHWVEDTKKLLQQLHANNYSLALFTNNWTGMGQKVLNALSVSHQIERIFESSVEKLRKPDPAFYQLIERELNTSGPNLYFIDDTKENLKTAQKRNWQTFLYTLANDNGLSSNNKLRRALGVGQRYKST